MTRVVQQATDVDLSDLATRADLDRKLAETKADILKWMVGSIAFQMFAVLGGALAIINSRH